MGVGVGASLSQVGQYSDQGVGEVRYSYDCHRWVGTLFRGRKSDTVMIVSGGSVLCLGGERYSYDCLRWVNTLFMGRKSDTVMPISGGSVPCLFSPVL